MEDIALFIENAFHFKLTTPAAAAPGVSALDADRLDPVMNLSRARG
jgi:hypothetical protein